MRRVVEKAPLRQTTLEARSSCETHGPRCCSTKVPILAETLVKLPERLVEKHLIRALLAEAWDLCQCKLL